MSKIVIPTRAHSISVFRLRRSEKSWHSRFLSYSVLFFSLCISCASLTAQSAATTPNSQQPAGTALRADLPNAPDPSQSQVNQQPLQTKRILGVIPNFRAVSTTDRLPAQSVKDKFVTATQDSFDYSSAFIPAALAGYSMGRNTIPEFGSGGTAYGRYLWHSAVDQTSENYMVEFIVPVVTHEDTRFYTLENGSFLKRAGYALSRAVVTRSDSGKEVFNVSEVFGAGASSGLSNLYYPSPERTLANTGTQWGLDIGIDAASMVAKEFWPDINRHLFHGRE